MTTFAKHQILPWLPEFFATYPALSVDIQVGPQYIDQFEQGLDIAIHSGVLPDSSRIARKVGESAWVICASPEYIERCGRPNHPQDLVNHDCFNFSFKSAWNNWEFEIDHHKTLIPVSAKASFAQGDLLRQMALSGAGIVKLAQFHIGADIRKGRLIPLLEEYALDEKEPIYMVYSNRKHLSPRIRVFRDFLETKIAEQPWAI